jgi:uncharacterized membrane protein
MRFQKFAIIAALTLLTLGVATASTANLNIFPDHSSTKVDSFTAYEVEITNTGTVDDVYDITSTNSDEIRIAPDQVPEEGTLAPGESQTVQLWFNPDLDRQEGEYTFRIDAESRATGETYSTEGTVEVLRDHTVNVEVENPGTVCRDEEAVYTVFVTNSGTQEEVFELSADAGHFSQEEVRVDRGETETVDLTRSSAIAVNDRSFNIKAESTSSYAEDVTSTSFEVESCYESSTTVNPENQRSAALTEAEFDVTIQNQGTRSDSFVLSTNYGELEDTELNIAAGDSRTTTLTYTPEELEDRSIDVTAEGESTSSATAELEVYNGQDVSVDFESNSQNVCEAETFEKEFTLENTGEAADTYSVSASRGELSGEQVELDPGETRRMELDFNSSEYTVGETYEAEVNVQSETFPEPSKSAVSSFTVEDCYNLEMSVIPKVQSAGENRSVLYEIHLENTGTKKNTYTVSGEGPDWISIRPGVVNVNSGDTGKSYVYAGIPYNQVDGTEEITVSASGEMVDQEETVELKIGEKVKDSLKDEEGGIARMIRDTLASLRGANNLTKLLLSILAGLVITAAILRKEW